MKNPLELQIIEELISKNEVEEVLALLTRKMNYENYATKYRTTIIMLSSNFESLRENFISGCIEYSDYELKFRQCKKSILTFIYSLPKSNL